MANNVEISNNLQLVNSYQKVAKEYGLYAKKVFMAQPGAEAKEFLVLSLSPIKNNVNPVAIINRNKRNNNIFYPENFAVELHSDNPLLLWERILSYMAYAEFMYEVYEQFDTPLPKAIRVDELSALANFYSKASNPRFDEETRLDYLKGLREFFKDENPKSKFKKEWQEFYRSELYDPDKSFVQNFFSFLKRDEPETSLDALIESNGDLKKVYMSEHHYKRFREIIKERHPDVKYSVGDKQVVDKGIIVDPNTQMPMETAYGITVTKEEYDRIIEARFAIDGYACIDGLTPSFFEGRDVIYKASDENIIASVGQEVTCRWAKCADLETLRQNGSLSFVAIPASHMMNFYVTMKNAGIPIYIDTDANSQPNFETVRIVYNTCYESAVQNILIGLTMAQVNLAHISLNGNDVEFDIDPQKVDALISQAKARAIESPTSDVPTLNPEAKEIE